MANTIVQYAGPSSTSGLSLTLELFPPGSDVLVGSYAMTEATNAKGWYLATVPDALDGDYRVTIKVGTNVFDNGWVKLADDTDTHDVTKERQKAVESGSGARTITISVVDGNLNPLEAAAVRLTNGAESRRAVTNASGVAVLNVDDLTWTVAITKPGYSFAGATLVVTADVPVTYVMQQVVVSPSDPGFATGYAYRYNELGKVVAGVKFECKAVGVSDDKPGVSIDSKVRSAASDANGYFEFQNLLVGVSYEVWQKGYPQRKISFTVENEDPFLISSFVGGEV